MFSWIKDNGNLIECVFWLVMIPIALIFFPNSIMALAFFSLWALVKSSWACHRGKQAEKAANTPNE